LPTTTSAQPVSHVVHKALHGQPVVGSAGSESKQPLAKHVVATADNGDINLLSLPQDCCRAPVKAA